MLDLTDPTPRCYGINLEQPLSRVLVSEYFVSCPSYFAPVWVSDLGTQPLGTHTQLIVQHSRLRCDELSARVHRQWQSHTTSI